jgi:hypothetical protein
VSKINFVFKYQLKEGPNTRGKQFTLSHRDALKMEYLLFWGLECGGPALLAAAAWVYAVWHAAPSFICMGN